jgi:hypothetical protein
MLIEQDELIKQYGTERQELAAPQEFAKLSGVSLKKRFRASLHHK